MTITAQASALGFKPASVKITGQVTRNGAPILNSGGTLNAFVPVVGSPLAPGMIVQIYGSNFGIADGGGFDDTVDDVVE